MGNKKRTVRYFPNMKVRGSNNRRIESFTRTMGALDRLSHAVDSSSKVFSDFSKLVSSEDFSA